MNKGAEVLIVGAGPVGLSSAVALAQAGVSIRIIDKLTIPIHQSRAAIIHARTLEHFERLGIVNSFLVAGIKVHGVAMYGAGNVLLMRPSLDHLPTAYPFMLGLEQTTTERLLTVRLKEMGVEVERGIELLDCKDRSDSVSVLLQYPDGTQKTEEFAYLLGADGAHSAVRVGLGFHFEGETLDTIWITADVKIRWDRDPGEAVSYLSKEGIVFIVALNDGRWRVVVNFHEMTQEKAEKMTLDDIQAIVRKRFEVDISFYDPVWISPFSISTRLVPTMQRGRVFLAGDAAHIHSPIGGQGMNTGIQDALNLAWKLALVLRGWAKLELLESYNAERHANARQLLSRIHAATKMANLRHPIAIELRNRVIHLLGELGLSRIMGGAVSMLNVAYPDSPIVAESHLHWLSGGPRAGDRAPDAGNLLCVGNLEPQRLFSMWRGDDRHQLLIFGDKETVQFPASSLYSITRIISEGTPENGVAVDVEGSAHAAYAVSRAGACYLVRPDGVIAFRSGQPDTMALSDYLAKWYKKI